MKYSLKRNLLALTYVVLFSTSLRAEENIDELMEMSIEQLMDITVTSVSKTEEKILEAPAAIYVLTGEDIRRLGATSIPEALRAVPGLQVAQSKSSGWAVSSRGFNGGFSNKLLVLVDGRTVYTSLYSGVYWDTIDYLLEDIDRIEVIRGPGATLWGANAVNGVINIITKDASETHGSYVRALAGDHETGTLSARYGGETSEGHYRVYGKFTDRNHSDFQDIAQHDGWNVGRAGFRIDTHTKSDDTLTLQGDAYHGRAENDLLLPEVTFPYYRFADVTEKTSGANVLGRWNRKLSNISNISTQAYLDYTRRDSMVLDQQILTADLDFQHSYEGIDKHKIIWGAGARLIYDDLDGSFYVNFSPKSDTRSQFNTFIEDKITLIPNELFLTLGTKLEWNEYTDFEIQPNARLGWNINENNFLWASVSRAVQTPNRSSDSMALATIGMPTLPPPLPAIGPVLVTAVDGDIDSVELIAYELGYKTNLLDKKLYVDTSLFYHDYDNLISTEMGTPVNLGSYWLLPLIPMNLGSAETYGAEIAVEYHINENWKLAAAYTYLNVDLDGGSSLSSTEGNTSPDHQFNIRSHLNFADHWEMDNMLYYVDEISNGTTKIDEYIRFDTRIAYKPNANWEFSIVGQNLFDDWHQEFFPFQFQQSAEVGRSVYGSITWKF